MNPVKLILLFAACLLGLSSCKETSTLEQRFVKILEAVGLEKKQLNPSGTLLIVFREQGCTGCREYVLEVLRKNPPCENVYILSDRAGDFPGGYQRLRSKDGSLSSMSVGSEAIYYDRNTLEFLPLAQETAGRIEDRVKEACK